MCTVHLARCCATSFRRSVRLCRSIDRFLTASLIVAIVCCLAGPAFAQDATGTVEGRVLNAANGTYLSKARVIVEGTNLEALTNDFGEYRILNVPAGSAKLTVSYTGQAPRSAVVTVAGAAVVTQDFQLGKPTTSADGTVQLNEFVVSAQRYKTAEEIAVNEERFSPNIKNVVATDAFGHIPDGNVGEFVKYLPGVDTQYGDADAFAGAGLGGVNQASASQVSIRGFGAADTAITIDGMPLSGISPAGLSRAVGLDMLSINNASRIEIVKVPTPDMLSEAGGGTVNLVTRSAFEFARPTTTVSLHLNFNSEETDFFQKTPGPVNEKTFHTLPGGSINFVYPYSKTLGFAINVASANTYSPNRQISTTWRTTQDNYSRRPTVNPPPTNAVTNAAGNISDLANPFLRQATIVDNPWTDYKQSASFKTDWRPTRGVDLSASYTYSQYTGINAHRRIQLSAEQPQDWGADYVIGRPYEPAGGGLNALDPGNKAAMEVTTRDREGFNQQGYVKVTYARGPWAIDANASLSEAYGEFRDMKNDHFSSIAMSLGNVGQVIMRDIRDGTPYTLSVFDRAGTPIDFTRLNNWTLDNATTLNVGTTKAFQRDKEERYSLNVRRELNFQRFNLALKAGGAKNIKEQRKWGLGTGYRMRYIGPRLTNDQILDTVYEREPGFGLTRPQQWADTYRLFDVYETNPEYFTPDFDHAMSRENYRTTVTQNKAVKDSRTSWYAQIETRWFKNRLTVIGGVNKSQSDVSGRTPYTDTKWNYVKNTDGTLYTDAVYPVGVKFDGSTFNNASGQSVRDVILTDTALQGRLRTAGISFPDHLVLGPGGATGTTNNTMEAVRLSYYTRYLEKSVSNPVRPSVVTSFNVRDDLVLKTSWNRATTLPALDSGNNGTAGILGVFNLNENLPPTGLVGGEGVINVANPSLKPKTTDAWNIELAYYTKNGGRLAGTYYYSTTKNNWETLPLYNTDPEYAQVLNAIGLDPASFADWTINTTVNGDERSKQTGYEFALRQNLGLLHDWGKFFNVFANYSHKNQKPSQKPGVVQLTAMSTNTWGAGVNFSMRRFSTSVKMTYRNALFTRTGNSVSYNGTAYQLYDETPEEYKVDVDLDYQLTRRYTIWVNGRNVFNEERTRYRWDAASGIMPEYARIQTQHRFGVQVTAGVTGRF